MIHTTNIMQKVNIKEYYLLRGIKETKGIKTVIQEQEFEEEPSICDIGDFLKSSKADFVSMERNYRLVDFIPPKNEVKVESRW